MVRRALLTIALLGAAACGKASVVRNLEDLADKTCACRDRACLEAVERAHPEERVVDTRGLAQDDIEALDAAQRRRAACRERILTAHAP